MPTKVLEYCFYPVRSLEKPDRPDLPGILLLQVRSLTGLSFPGSLEKHDGRSKEICKSFTKRVSYGS